MKCFAITITGELRGRGLRGSAMYMAFSLGIRGFVEYNHAGGIVIEAEGDEEHLEKFMAWLRTFIQSWKISDFSFVETTPKGYSSFDLRNDTFGEETAAHSILFVRYLNLFFWKMRRMSGPKKNQIITHKNKHANYL